MSNNNGLFIRYRVAKRTANKNLSAMKRNKRRKHLEVEAAYLIRDIEKFNDKNHPTLLEYALMDIEKLETLGAK